MDVQLTIVSVLSGSTLIAVLVGMIHIGQIVEKVSRHDKDIEAIWKFMRDKRYDP